MIARLVEFRLIDSYLRRGWQVCVPSPDTLHPVIDVRSALLVKHCECDLQQAIPTKGGS